MLLRASLAMPSLALSSAGQLGEAVKWIAGGGWADSVRLGCLLRDLLCCGENGVAPRRFAWLLRALDSQQWSCRKGWRDGSSLHRAARPCVTQTIQDALKDAGGGRGGRWNLNLDSRSGERGSCGCVLLVCCALLQLAGALRSMLPAMFIYRGFDSSAMKFLRCNQARCLLLLHLLGNLTPVSEAQH